MGNRAYVLVTVALLIFLVGCGGGGSSSPAPVTAVGVVISASQTTVPAGGNASFSATVTGNSNHAVTWQVNGTTGGDINVGTIDTAGLYTAPAVIPTPAQVSISAISQADSTKTATAPLTVTLSVSPSAVWLPVNNPTCTQAFTSTGQGTAGLDWSLTLNGSPLDPSFGAVNASGVYTPPNSTPSSPIFNVTATSQADSTQTGKANVSLGMSGPLINESLQLTPVVLGTSGGNVQDSSANFCCSGTLGSLVTRGGVDYILSNNHVLARSDAGHIGDLISQPGLVDTQCGNQSASSIAKLSQFSKLKGHTNNVAPADAAIAQVVSGEVDSSGAIIGLGPISCGIAEPAPPASTTVAPTVGMAVAKSGRTTGITCGTISATNVLVEVQYENSCGGTSTFVVDYDNQVEIDSTTFSAPGDSGSLIVDSTTSEPTALLYAGDSSSTIGNPIQDVLAALADTSGTHAQPTFVGGSTHVVPACAGPHAGAEAASLAHVTDQEMARAKAAKEHHAASLMADPAMVGIGVGASENPGEAVVVLFVDKTKTPATIPSEIDGVKTRVKLVNRFRAFSAACGTSAGRKLSSTPTSAR